MTKKRWLILVAMVALVVVVVGFVVAEQQVQPKKSEMMAGTFPPCPMPEMGMGPGMGANPGEQGNPRFGAIDQLMLWERAAKALALSPEQKKKIESIFIEQKKKNIQLKADLEVQKIDLITALRETSTNEAQVKEISKKIGRTTAEMIESGIDGILQAKKILTPEQQEKAMQLIQKQKQNRGMPMMGQGQRPPMMNPGMMQPGMMQPGMMNRGMMGPEMMQPGMMGPMQPQGNQSTEDTEDSENN